MAMKLERTTPIPESDEVMAMCGDPMVSYRGKWQNIKITKVSDDEELPLDVRESLVGLIIPTIFTKEQLESKGVKLSISDDSRLAYVDDVVNVLENAGKNKDAEQLEKRYPDFLDMYVAEGGIYELVDARCGNRTHV